MMVLKVMINIETNKYQTPITEELLNSLPDEVQEQLIDYITNVKFIQNLISPSRQYAKDRPRDEKGRIIVDLANPHIVENMDYFREAALHFKKYGCYTFLKPNRNPNSEYGKWIKRELERCWEGMVRPEDGEWVTGYMYWYLNYCPIMLTEAEGENTIVSNRVEDFPHFWEGIYWRFHYLEQARRGGLYNDFRGGQHAAELSRRGCSKSFSLAAMMSKNLVLGENKKANKRTMTVLTAYQKEYLAGKDGTLSKFLPMLDFQALNTQFPRRRLKDSLNEMMWQMGYKDVDTGAQRGTLNTVIGVSSKDDEDKLRGKRGYILFEEFGSFPHVKDIYNVVRYGVEEGNYVFGLIYLVGTAGNDENDFTGAQELVYNTKGYNIYSIPNVYDKANQGRKNFAFFYPAYINRKGCYNKDGVSDVIKALIEILLIRYNTKYNSDDPNTIVRVIADMPITPAEAIVRVGKSIFPIADLNERLNQLESNSKEFDDIYIGQLAQKEDGTVKFVLTDDTPIRDFPIKDNKSKGAIEFYAMPEKMSNGKVPYNRYIIGHDPVDNDQAESMSLTSTFVLDLWTDKIVAEYTGRQDFADDNFEIVRKLCIFYNAKVLYESNKKGLFAYFSKMNCTHLLADTPEYLRDKQLVKYAPFGSNAKGVNANKAINSYADGLTRDWLLKPVPIIVESDGEQIESVTKNLFFLKNKGLIHELLQYNSEGNFDRIRAFGMLMLYREEFMILYGGDNEGSKNQEIDTTYLGNSDFFTKNYDNRFK